MSPIKGLATILALATLICCIVTSNAGPKNVSKHCWSSTTSPEQDNRSRGCDYESERTGVKYYYNFDANACESYPASECAMKTQRNFLSKEDCDAICPGEVASRQLFFTSSEERR